MVVASFPPISIKMRVLHVQIVHAGYGLGVKYGQARDRSLYMIKARKVAHMPKDTWILIEHNMRFDCPSDDLENARHAHRRRKVRFERRR